jgi:hypothetical protein
MTSFRRSVAADTKKKGGKSKGAWYDKYRLPTTQPGSPIILMKGEYVDPNPAPEQVEMDPATGRAKPVINPYFKYRVHKRKLMQGGKEWFADEICSAGNDPHNPQPCVGCFAVDSGDKSIGVGDAFCFTIVHLAYYHGHPLLDREKGGIVMKNDNSGPVMITSECEGRTCNFCRVLRGEQPLPPAPGKDPWPGYDPRSLTTIFGKRRYLDLGKGHLSDIEGLDQVISSQCGNCHSQLVTDGFSCPICNTLIVDMANDPRSDEQIAQDVIRPYPCMRCNRPVLLKEIISCETCEAQNAKGLQLSIFDVVVYGMRQGEGTKSHITQGLPHKTIEDFARTVDPAFLGGKTMREFIVETGKLYDFEENLKPRTLQDQAFRLKLPLPSGGPQMGYQQPMGPQMGAYNPQQFPQQPGHAQPVPYTMPQQPSQMFAPQPNMGQPFQPNMGAPLPQPGMAAPYQPYAQQAPQPGQATGPMPFVPLVPPNYGKPQ